MNSSRDLMSLSVPASVGRRAPSISIFLWMAALVAAVTAILVSRGVLVPSPITLVVAVSMTVTLWTVFPRRWINGRHLAAATCVVLFAGFGFIALNYCLTRPIEHSVRSIIASGGRVDFDYEWADEEFFKTKNGWIIPTWCRKLLGDCFFAGVDDVRLDINSDGVLSNLVLDPVIEIAHVHVHGDFVTDESLLSLSLHNRVRRMKIDAENITDNGIRHLARLSRLESLWLERANVSDACIQHLKNVQNLRYLWFHNTNVTKAGVFELQRALPACRIEILEQPTEAAIHNLVE